jgi:predicted O-methyltransferase YrrM
MFTKLLNGLGFYTRGQVSSILGEPIDQVLPELQQLPEWAGGLLAQHRRRQAGFADACAAEPNNEEVQSDGQMPLQDLRRLLLDLNTLHASLRNKPGSQWDGTLDLVRAAINACARLPGHPESRQDDIRAALHGVVKLCDYATRDPQSWHDDALHLLHALLPLIQAKQDQLCPNLSGCTMEFVRPRLERSLSEFSKELLFEQVQERSRIRELYLAELFEGIEEVSVPVGAVNEETGHANAVDLLFVSAMARQRKARRLFEIGTYMGRTSYHLTYASEDAVVTTVNLPPEADPRWGPYLQIYFRGRERAAQIRQVWADSTRMDTTPYRAQMDFVFVDGDHSYEAAKADTGKALEVLAPGGMIVWHDYAAKSPGVCRFFEEFTQKQPVFRIRKTCLLVHIDGVDPLSFSPLPMRPSKEQKVLRKKLAGGKAA